MGEEEGVDYIKEAEDKMREIEWFFMELGW